MQLARQKGTQRQVAVTGRKEGSRVTESSLHASVKAEPARGESWLEKAPAAAASASRLARGTASSPMCGSILRHSSSRARRSMPPMRLWLSLCTLHPCTMCARKRVTSPCKAHDRYRQYSIHSEANLPTPMYWHNVPSTSAVERRDMSQVRREAGDVPLQPDRDAVCAHVSPCSATLTHGLLESMPLELPRHQRNVQAGTTTARL
jgi:hypothetical protein